MGQSGEHHHNPIVRLLAVLYFMGSSMLVQYTTKSIFTVYKFRFPVTVALLQMSFISPVSYMVARPPITLENVRALAPLAFVNVLNVVSGLIGTGGLNVPMFIALRRFTLLFTILLERFWLKKSHDWPTLGAVTIMIGGACVAAATDLTFNAAGYLAVLANDVLTSLYLIIVKNTPATNGLTTTGMLFYNSTMSIPLLGLAATLLQEPVGVATFPLLWDSKFRLALMAACALGLSINHSTFVCTRVNEPLMTSVAGNLKNIVMTVVGAFAFGDFAYEYWNTLGLVVSMVGALWYATRAALKARQRVTKDALLQQTPVIGRDRLKAKYSDVGRSSVPAHSRQGENGGSSSSSSTREAGSKG